VFSRWKELLIAAACAVCSEAGTTGVAPPTLLDIDVENIVSYSSDVFDVSKFATDSHLTTAAPPRNFGFVMAVGDIVSVNGKPARGSLIARQQAIILNPSPSPGQGIADVVRTAVTEFLFDIQQADGTRVGSIHTLTGSGGSPPLGLSEGGSPLGATLSSNQAVVGGTGAFVGARGQGASAVLPGNTGPRAASITEDPARRRDLGGGKVHFVIQLFPMMRPEIVIGASGPAVLHGDDFIPVTAARPARPGETLIAIVTALGPTRAGVDFGKPFPANPLQTVNSPVEITVNGKPTDVTKAVGWPGLVDTYRVEFRMPDDSESGLASVQVSAAWIAGRPITIAIQ